MSKHPIPAEALDDRLGFVGTAGSGKTYTMMTNGERILDAGSRACFVDPLGVTWGLRLMADGKTPSRFATAKAGSSKRLVIFGGPHGDLPLTENSGKLIGETVAGMAESCILDLSEIGTSAGERRFMYAFTTALYRKTRKQPLHFIVDEADMFAPQRVLDKEGDANKLLGMMQTIVRRGRIKGFIPWLITQRPAEISKSVLSQIDGLIIGKLTASQDLDAIGAWVTSTANKKVWDDARDQMAGYGKGEALLWIPGRGLLKQVSFPEKTTFDSSRTPKRGETITAKTLEPLDLGKLKELLATVEEDVKQSNIPALRAELAKTKKELAAALKKPAAPGAPVVDQRALKLAVQDGYNIAVGEFTETVDPAAVLEAIALMPKLAARLDAFQKSLKKFAASGKPIPKSASPAVTKSTVDTPMRKDATTRPASNPKPVMARGDGSYTNPQLNVLRSMAWWAAMGHDQPTRTQVAAIAKMPAKGSNLRNRLTELSGKGAVEYVGKDAVRLTETGVADAPAPDTSETLIANIKAILTNPQLTVFDAMLMSGAVISRDDLADAIGWPQGGSNLRNRLTELSGLDLVDYVNKTDVALKSWVTA